MKKHGKTDPRRRGERGERTGPEFYLRKRPRKFIFLPMKTGTGEGDSGIKRGKVSGGGKPGY